MSESKLPAQVSRILVVDDDPATLRLLANAFSGEGFSLHTIPRAELALQSVLSYLPDLILLNLALPDLDGYQICADLKADALTRAIPVIFLTGLIEPQERVRGFQLGAVDTIAKPCQADEVLARVKMHLMQHTMRKQLAAQNAQLQQANDELARSIAEHSRISEALALSEEKYRALVENINDVHFSLDPQGCFLYISPSIEQFARYPVDEVIGQAFPRFVHPDDLPDLQANFARALNGEITAHEFRVIAKDGVVLHVRTSSRPLWDGDHLVGLTGLMTNITTYKQADDVLQKAHDELELRVKERTAELAQANRMLKIISDCNQTVVRSTEELALAQEICRIIVDLGGYPLAWIGYAERDAACTVRPIAWRGVEAEKLAHADISWADTERGQGPAGIAIRSGLPSIVRNSQPPQAANDTSFAPWLDAETRSSFTSCIALPLRAEKAVFGALNIYAMEPNAFQAIEMEVLLELTNDLAYGVLALQAQAERKRAEEDLFNSQQMLRLVLDTIPQRIFWKDRNSVYLGCNKPLALDTGYTDPSEIIGKTDYETSSATIADLYRADDRQVMETGVSKLNYEEPQIKPDGSQAWLRTSKVPLCDQEGRVIAVLGMYEDITEHKWAELVREATHKISQAAISVDNLKDLYRSIHEILGELMPVKNFFIALYDAANDLLDFPYYVDQYDESPGPVKPGRGMTEYVLRTGRSILATPAVCEDLAQRGEVELVGTSSVDWLGAPLRVEARIIGVIAVQSYSESMRYSQKDISLLEFVSSQVAMVIERKRSEVEKLHLLEETRRHLQRLDALHSIDMAITANLELPVKLNILLDQVISQLEVDAADILLLDPSLQTLEFAVGRGFRTPRFQRSPLQLSESSAARVIMERTPLYIPNLAETRNKLELVLQMAGENFVAYYAMPLISKGQVRGALEIFHRSLLDPEPEWLNFLVAISTQAAIAIDNAALLDALRYSNQELTMAYDATLEGWSRALELRDQDTEGHTRRVTALTLRLAKTLRVNDADLVHLRRGALLHDIGKMGISDTILQKPGPLSEQEIAIMEKHPTYAFEMLYPIIYLRPALDIPYRHHEKWDGTGYPWGLKGEQIPLAARIFAVVDVWDALNSDRPYRKAWSRTDALEYIRSQSSAHFDPRIVKAFLALIQKDH